MITDSSPGFHGIADSLAVTRVIPDTWLGRWRHLRMGNGVSTGFSPGLWGGQSEETLAGTSRSLAVPARLHDVGPAAHMPDRIAGSGGYRTHPENRKPGTGGGFRPASRNGFGNSQTEPRPKIGRWQLSPHPAGVSARPRVSQTKC